MKNLLLSASLLLALAVASPASAQISTENSADEPSNAEVASARCQYTGSATCGDSTENLLAQYGRSPMHGRYARPHRAGYPVMWSDPPSSRRVAIGAGIGFGLGAVVGFHANKDQHPGVGRSAAILGGCIGALIGAAVASAPTLHAVHHPHRPWPGDEDEEEPEAARKPAKNKGSTSSFANRRIKPKHPVS